MKNAMNLHVPMPGELHNKLRQAAARLGKPATVVVREAIEIHLRSLQKQAIDLEISDWAREMSGTDYDLDKELETASVEFLLNEASHA